MTFVSNDPSWWPFIDPQVSYSYWIVVAGVVVVYDWVLTVGQEIELIWVSDGASSYNQENTMNSRQRQRWSLMTVLYLVIRYIGIPFSVANALANMPLVSLTDAGCDILEYATNWTNVIMAAMLGVIMIARLHAMYQGSRTMLLFLVIIFLAVNIACVVLAAIALKYMVAEELILSGIHMCDYGYEGDSQFLASMIWMLNTVWEVLALCLSVWIAVKNFLDLRRLGPSTGSTIGDCFRVLMKSHVLYFASFAGVSCFQLIRLSPVFLTSYFIGIVVLYGILTVFTAVQMFVLGPRLILSVREYHAKLVAAAHVAILMYLEWTMIH